MLRVKAAACRWSKRTAGSLRQVSAPLNINKAWNSYILYYIKQFDIIEKVF